MLHSCIINQVESYVSKQIYIPTYLIEKYDGNALWFKIDEDEPRTSKYGIQGIPVIKFFREGKEVGEIVGYLPQVALTKEIENISKNAPTCLANTSLSN
jgi:thioredoxin-related protein